MLDDRGFITQSLKLHIFFARIMKEHAIFLNAGFTPVNTNLKAEADYLKNQFEMLLSETVGLSGGIMDEDVLKSGEIVTKYTLPAEVTTEYYTGIHIQTNITRAEYALVANYDFRPNPMLIQRIFNLNQRAIALINAIIQFKTLVINEVSACRIFTHNYPLQGNHILNEAKQYLKLVEALQKRDEIDTDREIYDSEMFWNDIMHEHAEFIRGLLDPSEKELIKTSDNFAKDYEKLIEEMKKMLNRSMNISKATDDSLKLTSSFKAFKEKGTDGIIECNIKSIILPLLSDHVLREANYYLRLLKKFKNI